YDRVSPNAEVASTRVHALGRLAAWRGGDGPLVILTTVNAILQRVPPVETFRDAVFRAATGEALDRAALDGFLARNGYSRTSTVREAGEYAIRGGIVDIYPSGADDPLRIDLFGDDIEKIREFDAI